MTKPLTYLYDTDAAYQSTHNNTVIADMNLRAARYYDFDLNAFNNMSQGSEFEFYPEDLSTDTTVYNLFLRINPSFGLFLSPDLTQTTDANGNILVKLPNKRLTSVRYGTMGFVKSLFVST